MGLFGQNPSDQGVADQAAYEKQAMEMAKLSQDQMSSYAMASGGLQAGRGLKGLLGIEDPQLQELKIGKEMMKGVDMQDPKALKELAKAYAARGMHRFGEEAYTRAIALEKAKADLEGTTSTTAKNLALAHAADARAERELKVAENAAKSDGFKNLPPEVQTILKLAEEDPSFDKVKAMKDYLAGKGKAEWSDPFKLDGATVQKNLKTNETRTAVPRPPVTHINAGSGKPLSTNDIKEVNKLRTSVNNASANVDKADEYISGLEAGIAKFGAASNTASNLRTLFGSSTEGDRFKQNVEKYTTASVNAVLNAAKGPQTDQDAERARQQILTGLQKNDTKSVLEGLKQLKKLHAEIYDNDSESLDLFSVERKRDLGPKKNTAKAGSKENPIKLD